MAKLHLTFDELAEKWDALATRINRLGGERFLNNAEAGIKAALPLTQADLMTLIKFCHPDKHGGSEEAGCITAKLLALRDK